MQDTRRTDENYGIFKKLDFDNLVYNCSEREHKTLWTRLRDLWFAFEQEIPKHEPVPSQATPSLKGKPHDYEDFKGVNLNDFIAHLTDMKNSCPADYMQTKESEEKRITMYACLRDQFGAKTVGDAVNKFRLRELPKETVELWAAEGYIGTWEYDAIQQAYPEIKLPKILPDKEFDDWMAEIYGDIMFLEEKQKEDEERDSNGFDTSGYDGWSR